MVINHSIVAVDYNQNKAQAINSIFYLGIIEFMGGKPEQASSSVRGSLDWILGRIILLKEWSSIGTGCPGKWWGHHPWRCSKYM